jgi:hypothetical protein
MSRANESAPGPGRSERLANDDSTNLTDRPSRLPAAGISRLALTPVEAAGAIGCSPDFFDTMIRPELRVIRRGRKVFISIAELASWLEREAARTIGPR